MKQNQRILLLFVVLMTAVLGGFLFREENTKAGTLDPQAYLPIILSPPGDVPFGPVHSGDGTYYWEANGEGNCLFPPSPDNLMIAAMNNEDYGNADLCGAYIKATGPKGSVVVRIVDRCANCPKGDVDFSPEAFAIIADLPQGRVDITWQLISPVITTPVAYYFDPGGHQWWTAVQIRNHRNPISKFEYWNGSNWVNVNRAEWNMFIEENGMGPGPYTFRVTDNFGNQLVDSNIPLTIGGTVTGSSQFPPPP